MTKMKSAQELWADNLHLAQECLDHPFVRGIASGSLARSSFQVYVAQDAFFLEAFARAYALGLAKCPTREGLEVFKDLLNGVFDELKFHESYAAEWDIDLTPEPLPSTRAYTDFLLSTAGLEPVGHIAAAMTPCMRLYAWLGQQLIAQSYSDFWQTGLNRLLRGLRHCLNNTAVNRNGSPDFIAPPCSLN